MSSKNRKDTTAVAREHSVRGEAEKMVNNSESVQKVLLDIASHAHKVGEGVIRLEDSFYKDYFEPERMFSLCMEQNPEKTMELLETYRDNPVSSNFAARLRAAVEREKSQFAQEELKAKFSSRPSSREAGHVEPAPKRFVMIDDGETRYLFGTGKSLKPVIRALEKLCAYGTSRPNSNKAADGMDQENPNPSMVQLFELDASRIVGGGHVKVPSEFLALIGRQRSALNAALVGCSAEALEAVNNGTREPQQKGKIS